MKRKQFTFYYSFYDVISCIEEPPVRAEAYDALCRYALMGEKPDFENLSLEAKMAVKAFMPTLDASRKKAQGGMKGTSKSKDTNKMSGRSKEDSDKMSARSEEVTENKNKNKIEIKTEEKTEIKKELKHESEAAFDLFWDEYPRKVKKQQAREAFKCVSVSLDILLEALSRQKKSSQWQEDGGRFVPYPAVWLRDRRWEDDINEQGTVIPKGCGPMKQVEYGDLAKLMGSEASAAGGG